MKIKLNWKLEELSILIKTNLIQNLYKNKWNSKAHYVASFNYASKTATNR